MIEFIEFLFKGIVTKPEAVTISTSEQEGWTIYAVNVATEDMGAVIGKEGKTINSLRNLVRAKAIKDNVHVKIVLNEPEAK